MAEPLGAVLIANRGEIALRVMRTAHRLGWRTVAIHTDLDVHAPHVRAADQAVRVGSYLDIDEVVAAALESGAGFVHPGYGFLSERAPFARALADAGIVLVGPSAEVMDAMGRKDKARDIALAAGVPVVPSYDLDADPATFAYPVLVKAAAGGGGKGMRVVRAATDFVEACDAARRESLKAFGDDTLLVEKYVESGRHIEVQVMGDTHGHVVHFFERDCSTQRRHQKVLEEAPAPTIGDRQRAAITASAVALAQQCGYTGAGTVEFLLDNATGEFYFLEMNTRLQVEHPVTEEVARVAGDRIDLVELQLLVATGEPLPFGQDAVTLTGHAIEARVYAEDSFHGFLPQAGVATDVTWPTTNFLDDISPRRDDDTGAVIGRTRVDHALESGQEVSTSYDPMLGKVITWAATREEARSELVLALDSTQIFGLTTNTGFLRALVASEEFRDAAIDTAWLDRNDVPAPDVEPARAMAAYALSPDRSDTGGPWHADGWRMGADPAPTVIVLDRPVVLRPGTVDARPAELLDLVRGHVDVWVRLTLAGELHSGVVQVHSDGVEVVLRGQRHVFTVPDPFADSVLAAGDGTLLAPMPGTVLAVNVSEGQDVAEGETLGVMEAMKMELALKAPFAGTVSTVGAAVGDLVTLGATLFVVEAADE